MGGTSIVQAKASLLYALGRLDASDRFNVIRFDDTMDMLFPDTVVPRDFDVVDIPFPERGAPELVRAGARSDKAAIGSETS